MCNYEVCILVSKNGKKCNGKAMNVYETWWGLTFKCQETPIWSASFPILLAMVSKSNTLGL
jgi:hypothetical protein